MLRRVFVVAVVALAVSASVANAQQKIEKVPIKPTSAADAKEMFETYCAVCHGKEGKGNGPAATALTKVPADLTRISARNGGTFPEVRVRRFIEGLDQVGAHGTRDMPIWGGLFRSLSTQNPEIAQLRIAGLSNYLKSFQQ
jgi:mono/diheme cytochrome c family protein